MPEMWEVCLTDPSSQDAKWEEFEERRNDSPAWAVAEDYVRENLSEFEVDSEDSIWARLADSNAAMRFDVVVEMTPDITIHNAKEVDLNDLNVRCPHTADMFEQASAHG